MKKVLRHTAFAAAALLLLSSCEIPFSLENTAEPKIYIQCIPSPDSTVLQIRYAAPAVGNAEESVPASFAPQVSVLVNSVPRAFENEGEGRFVSHDSLQEGDEIQVDASSPGLPSASGKTLVPPVPAIADLSFETVEVDTVSVRKVTITLQRAPEEGEYYGLQVRRRTAVLYWDGSFDSVDLFIVPGKLMTALDAGGVDMEDFMQVNFTGGLFPGNYERPMSLLTAKQFEGNRYSFYLDSADTDFWTALSEVDWENYEWGPNPGDEEEKDTRVPLGTATYCQVFLYRLSPETYRFAKAVYQSGMDFLANMGLIPANFTYSNVEGGLGVVGALSCDTADFLEADEAILKLFPEQNQQSGYQP